MGKLWIDTPHENFYTSPIMDKYACVACHTVGDRGGSVGPILNNVGYRRSKDWLTKWLTDPNKVKNGTIMPKFPFKPGELEQAVGYLTNLRLDMKIDQVLAESIPSVEKGEKLFNEYDCYACHSLKGRGRTIGPNLNWVGIRKSEAWEKGWRKGPPGFKPGTFMPNFRMSDEAIESLAAFLHQQQGEYNAELREEEQLAARFFGYGQLKQGKQVFDRLACGACHGERLRQGVTHPNAVPDGVVPALFSMVRSLNVDSLRKRVSEGSQPAKQDAAGPDVLYECPAYGPDALDDADAKSLLAYLQSLAPKKRRFKFKL